MLPRNFKINIGFNLSTKNVFHSVLIFHICEQDFSVNANLLYHICFKEPEYQYKPSSFCCYTFNLLIEDLRP